MTKLLEKHMIEPVARLMQRQMGLDVISQEFTAGYGIADLVGAQLCFESIRIRESLGLSTPLDHKHILEVLKLLTSRKAATHAYLCHRISFSESTLNKKILPEMSRHGLISRSDGKQVRLLIEPPSPASSIVAVEVKQTRWRDAIVQARRYSFFADQTYIAVWNGTADLVDRSLLYRLRIGLIGVEPDGAEILVEAPKRKPREPKMNRYCAEALYRKVEEQ